MKRLIVIVIVIISSVQLTYADLYQIYSFENSVYVKSEKNDWQQVRKKLQINSTDSIQLGTNSCIKILDVSSGSTFEWKEQGKYEVSDIVRDCLTKKAHWIQRLFSTLINNVTDEPNKLWVSQGGTLKGDNNDILEHSLAKELLSYCYGLSTPSSDLVLKAQGVGKRELSFDITNKTTDTLYVNVLAVNIKQKSFTVLYDIREGKEKWMIFPIAPKSTLSMSDFTVSNNKNYKYVAFGTSKPIGILKLEKYLNIKVLDDSLPKDEDIIIGTELKTKNLKR